MNLFVYLERKSLHTHVLLYTCTGKEILMAKRSHRVGALIFAILFLVSSLGVSALVIWELIQQNDNQADTSQQEQTQTPQGGTALKGTQLQDYEPVEEVKELKIVEIQEGTGKEVKKSDVVTAHYTGAVASTGVIFESSLEAGQPATFPLDAVIKGWQQGVPGMKEGGKRRLIIPASLAYGKESPSPDIPANSDLVFDIEILAVNPPQQ